MRLTTYIAIAFIAALSLGFASLSNPVTISGKLRNGPKERLMYLEGISVLVKGDNKVLAQAFADSKGEFVITFTPDKEKSFDFYCTGLGMDTLLISSVRMFESDTPTMTFDVPSKPKRNVLNKAICPICERADKVYRIRHSDAPVATLQVSKSGDTTYSPIHKGKYQAGCLGGLATYYCDREKVKF